MNPLTLKIIKDPEGNYVFDVKENDPIWKITDLLGQPRSVRERNGEPGLVWFCAIDYSVQRIDCTACSQEKAPYLEHLPLQAGIVVLSDLHDCRTPNGNPVTRASFRPPELQECMDTYNIASIRKMNPNRTYKATGGWDDSYTWETDGEILTLAKAVRISGATWAISRVWLPRESRFARILYTKKRISDKMLMSFLENGVNPES